MTELEDLLLREMRIWWDLSTLKKYMEKNMVPRGLRIRKFPSTACTEEFKLRWEQVLTDCSLNLMKVIVSQEESMLQETKEMIVTLQNTVKEYSDLDSFNSLDDHITENLKETGNSNYIHKPK